MKKVLLVEDDRDVRENTADLLELAGFTVETAENGAMGLEKAKRCRPDIILCDIMMPELDGYDVLRRLNAHKLLAGVPFIFLTAKVDRQDIRTGMNLGADDYITKPFEEHELLEAISSRLRKSELLKREVVRNVAGLNSFLEEVSEHFDLEALSRDYVLNSYSRKQHIYSEGEYAHSLFFIEKGIVKAYRGTQMGKDFIIGIFGAGDFLGQLSLLNSGGKYLESAVVLEDAEISAIPRSDFVKLLFGNHLVAQKFIEMVSNNLIDVQAKLVDMAFASVRQRAAKALIDLDRKGVLEDQGKGGMGIAREDFAGIIGTATETAIRTLSDFKDEGLIKSDGGRRIFILDKVGLSHIAELG